MKRACILTVLFIACVLGNIFPSDFGAVLNGEFVAEGGKETDTNGKTTLAPWVSLPLDVGELFFSAGLGVHYAEKTVFVPELLRLDYSAVLDPFTIRAGRIPWQDPSAFTVKGRFDGADFSIDTGLVQFGAACFYTGLLYKDTADINVNPGDSGKYSANFDWSDFSDTYFAPRRFLAALYGEFPGFPFQRGNLYAGILTQFDLSKAEERFHTQYLLLRHTLNYKEYDLNAAGAAELEKTEKNGIKAAFALSLEGGWRTPVAVANRLSLGMRWASGESSGTAAFFPVIREAQGVILKPSLSGIMVILTDFEARLLHSLSAGLGMRYFFRTDSGSFKDQDINKSTYPLGAELSGSALWAPFSDLSFSMEGGIFLPKTGTAMRDDAPVRWTVVLGTIFSF